MTLIYYKICSSSGKHVQYCKLNSLIVQLFVRGKIPKHIFIVFNILIYCSSFYPVTLPKLLAKLQFCTCLEFAMCLPVFFKTHSRSRLDVLLNDAILNNTAELVFCCFTSSDGNTLIRTTLKLKTLGFNFSMAFQQTTTDGNFN